MKKSTKAVFLSLLVLPGAGHLFLKKYITGFFLAGVSLSAVYYSMSIVLERALEIINKVQLGEVQPDIITITDLISKQSAANDSEGLSIATTSIIICWLIGIVDSYRVGRVLNKDKH